MLTSKVRNLLLIVVTIVLLVILSIYLTAGPNRMAAQARNEIIQQEQGGRLGYQGIYTNSEQTNFSTEPGPQAGQLKVVTDLKSAISPQSIESGFEYIPSSAFRSDGISPASEYRFWSTAGYIRNNSTSPMCLAAPVYVPNGATLTKFSMFFVDTSAASDLTFVKLWRKNLASPGIQPDEVASLAFPGIDEDTNFEGYNSINPALQTVSNNYGYYIGFCFAANTDLEQLVYGFKVNYVSN